MKHPEIRSSIATAGLPRRRVIPCDVDHATRRIKEHLARLEQGVCVDDRLRLWRAIVDCALEAHSLEVRRTDALNFPMADPALEVPIA